VERRSKLLNADFENMKTMKVLLLLLLCVVLFEFFEHLILPLLWLAFGKRRPHLTGAEGLLGKTAIVNNWKVTDGKVFVDGELWKAVGCGSYSAGDKAVIESVEGLVLRLKPVEREKEAT